MVWILKTEEIEQSTRRLERLKQSLVLSMLFSGMYAGSASPNTGWMLTEIPGAKEPIDTPR